MPPPAVTASPDTVSVGPAVADGVFQKKVIDVARRLLASAPVAGPVAPLSAPIMLPSPSATPNPSRGVAAAAGLCGTKICREMGDLPCWLFRP